MFSTQEAVHFVETVLALKEPLQKKEEHSLNFLNELVFAIHVNLPFQNVSVLAMDRHLRRLPTLSEIKNDGLKGRGGLCVTNNVFTCELLSSLGYHTSLLSGCVKIPDDHAIILVSDVTQLGSRHLVDVGFGYPIYEAISLDFETESPLLCFAGLTSKYLRNGDDFERWHLNGSVMSESVGWSKAYSFRPIAKVFPRDYEISMIAPFQGFFSHNVYIVKYSKNYVSALMNKSSQIHTLKISSDGKDIKYVTKSEALLTETCKLLQCFSADEISRAYNNFFSDQCS